MNLEEGWMLVLNSAEDNKDQCPATSGVFILQRGCLMQFALTNGPSTPARAIDGSQS